MEKLPNVFKLSAVANALSSDEKLSEAIVKKKKYVAPRTNNAIIGELLQSKYYDEYTQEELAIMKLRAENQGFFKEMICDARNTARAKIDADPDRYYGVNSAMSQMVKENTRAGTLNKYQYYTINIKPESQSDFGSIQKAIAKSADKVWVGRWLCSFEQRGLIGQPNFGTGLHINFLIEKAETHMSKKQSLCEKEMKNTWKNLCEVNIIGTHAPFMCRYAADGTNFENYVKGNKDFVKHPEKKPMVEADRLWRREYLRMEDYFGDWDTVEE